MILPHGARRLAQRLTHFQQWSELSPGYPSVKELLDSCELDENGQVTCAAKVTELTGETLVSAAQIYLQCRFFRYTILSLLSASSQITDLHITGDLDLTPP
jgi:hypothetical protein